MPKCTDFTVGDILSINPCAQLTCCCCSVIGFVAFILFVPSMFLQVDRLHNGLSKNGVTGAVDLDKVYQPGRYYMGFWQEFIMFPTYLQTIEFSNDKPEKNVQHLSALRSRDKDGKQIWLDVSVQYKLKLDEIPSIYRQMQTQYEDVYISELRDVLSKACNKFVISEVWENYKTVVAQMKARCVEVLAERHALCWGLQVWGVRLDTVYEQQLVKTQVRKQAQKTEAARSTHENTRAATQVELAEYKRDITVVNAEGSAKKFKMERNATATATAALTDAKAEVLEIIRVTVVPNMTARKMTGSELTTYVKLMQLETMSKAPLLYHPNGQKGADGATTWTRKLSDLASPEL